MKNGFINYLERLVEWYEYDSGTESWYGITTSHTFDDVFFNLYAKPVSAVCEARRLLDCFTRSEAIRSPFPKSKADLCEATSFALHYRCTKHSCSECQFVTVCQLKDKL